MPYVYGVENGVHISDVDYVIDGGRSDMPELKNPAATDVDQKVAAIIANEIADGACVQIGIGAMPNAVCELLARFVDQGPRRAHRDVRRFAGGFV